MKTLSFMRVLFIVSVGTLAANSALADHKHRHKHHGHHYYQEVTYYEPQSYGGYGRVLDAQPIYQRVMVEVPRESCRVETYAHEERRRGGDSFGGTVVGGLVGAAIGHELGHGRGGATAVGGLIGASIGNDVSKGSRRTVSYRDQEVCNTQYRTAYEQRLIGYDVSYTYHGRVYQTRTERHPGDRIVVAQNSRDYYRD